MIDIAYAMGPKIAEGGTQGHGIANLLPFIFIFVIIYFLMIRPQQKKAKQHREMLAALKKGDRIISSGGLYGVVTGLTDDAVTMEIAPKVRVKVSRGSIAGVINKEVQSSGA